MRKRAISVVSLSLLTLVAIVLFGAFFTGKVDGSEAWSAMTGDAKEVLKEHKLLGIYLAYASLVLLFLKFLNVTKSGTLKVLYMLALTGFVFAILHQGKEGGELVFKHGTNVAAMADLDEKAFDLKEELDELQEEYDELKEEFDELKPKEEKVEEPKEEKAEAVEEPEAEKELATEKEDSNETK
jgi:uncharacterized membrane protein